ncbi:PREDICTED: IRK-interacting protein [Camelina sativa]|uniref:IRK-interacting protein n=1 Tax=Camelina sativa TaxID=90675 RepID=A0ABM0T2A2_CAMSA|nr:PREDICTED: IRK-interacting protein [Camelina sativa]
MASSETRMNKVREKEEAIANGVKVRALQASLMHKSSPSSNNYSLRNPSSSSAAASPASRPLPTNLSAHDYPVFTPSYEDEPVSAFHHKNLTLSETWDEDGDEDQDVRHTYLSDSYKTSTSRKTVVPHQDSHHHVYTMSDALRSPPLHLYTSGRSNCGSVDFRSVSSCNDYNKQRGFDTKSLKNSNLVVPLTDSHSAVVSSQPRNRGGRVMSWLFPKLKKKQKSNSIFNSPSRTEKSEEVSEVLKDSGLGVEKLKRELIEATRSRDAALTQVSEMKSSLGELSEKLQYLESYCDNLKKALREATEVVSQENNVARSSGKKNSEMPVSEEVMVEGFLQIVSEARLSIKQFLKTLVLEIDEEDSTLIGNINTLLQPHNLTFTSKYSKIIQYHLEAIISQSVYQDFENCVFQKNGKPKLLDPEQDRQVNFASFASLRNLSWNEVLKKGTKYYSEEFSRFCDEKMSLIITTLNWTRPWSEQMLQAFFVASKCVWLLHLLAFSFNPALGILRVEENREFESSFMEDMGADRQRSASSRGPARVKVMVMPGFYVQDRVLRCKVLCRYKSLG